jgi:two-component system, NarL family, sensor kinase
MQQPARARFAVVMVAIAAVSLGVAYLLLHVFGPSDGSRLAPGEHVWRPDGVIVTPIQEQSSGLKQGDVVVAVEGSSMESWAQALLKPGLTRPQWHAGQTISYTVLRNGHRLDVPVTLEPYPLGAILMHEWSTVLFALVFLLVAAFVFLLRPDDRAARVQLLMGASIMGATTWSLGLQVGDLVNGIGFWLYLITTAGVYTLFWVGILHFALVFPEAHPVVAKRPWTIPFIYIVPFAFSFAYLAIAWPRSVSALDRISNWDVIESVVPAVYLVLTIVIVIWSYRILRTTTDRQKIRWLMFAALVSGGGIFFLWYLPTFILGRPLLSSNGLGLLVLPYPLALAIAILRYRLFDIDSIINRTLVYGILTAILVGMYVLVVSILSMLLHTYESFLNSLLATGLIAVLFQPLRVRLQRMINRLMYGERDDPYAVLSHLGSRLEATLAPDAVLPTIVETIAQALKLPYAAIALKQSEVFSISASYGLPQGKPYILPLIYQRETIGQLLLAPRAPGDDFTVADRRLLEDIAHQAGVAAHAVRLTADLQHSRERLVTTREEERRRLRRDLHDGLGSTLAALHLQVGAIRILMRHDLPAADAELVDLQTEIRSSIADIRRLVYALRPPTLDELGLVGAIQQFAAQCNMDSEADGASGHIDANLRVIVEEIDQLPTLPAAIEVAAYRIAQEALTNVVHHAHACNCTVRLSLLDGLQLDVTDDGVGLSAKQHAGVGLLSMRERATEVGGSCEIEPIPGHGTRVLVKLPLPKE